MTLDDADPFAYDAGMTTRKPLPIDFLRECFDYSPETGAFRWRYRPEAHFPSAEAAYSWNVHYAGSLAFASKDQGRAGYCRAEVRHNGRRLRLTAGRVAFAFVHGWAPHIVDHDDGDRANNRIKNLRPATDEQNMWNRHSAKDRGGIPRGAYLAKNGKWRACVTHKGRKIHLKGPFATEWDAHAAYREFVTRERGDFANLGPVIAVAA